MASVREVHSSVRRDVDGNTCGKPSTRIPTKAVIESAQDPHRIAGFPCGRSYCAHEHRYQHCSRQAFAGNVAEDDEKRSCLGFKNLEEIATNFARGHVDAL